MFNVVENRMFSFGAIQISWVQIMIIGTVILMAVILSLLFNKTRWGIALRAVSQDKTAACMVGINVKRTAMVGNCIGCGLGGVAGMLLSVYYQTLSATMGGTLGIKAFSSSVLGGLTDARYSALGGLFIGVAENLGITISSASFRDIFAFTFLILVLILKPEGFSYRCRLVPLCTLSPHEILLLQDLKMI